MATKTDGTLWTWGRGDGGSLGQNNEVKYSSPVQIPGTTWSGVGGGSECTGGVKTDGTLWMWGLNNDGQLGLNSRTNYSSPKQVPGTKWVSVAAAYNTGSSYATQEV